MGIASKWDKKEPKKDLPVEDILEEVKVDVSRTRPIILPKPKIIPIPDFNDIMQFAKDNMDSDIECEQFFRHGATRVLYKKHYNKDRGGGGWSGGIKATLVILNKMRKRND